MENRAREKLFDFLDCLYQRKSFGVIGFLKPFCLSINIIRMENLSLGEFEEVVLLTVAVLYNEAYGIAIKKEIETRLDRSVSVGAMRTALNRLEKKGFLESEFGEATKVRGGKRKRFFKVTPLGKKAMTQVMETRTQLWNSIPKIAFDFKLQLA